MNLKRLINEDMKLWPPTECYYCGKSTTRAIGVPGYAVPCCWACDLEQAILLAAGYASPHVQP